MDNLFNKKTFKDMSIYRIRAIADINTKKLTKYEKELLNDELHDLYMTIVRRTNDLYERYSRD